jgi:hypothetical protein
MREAFKMKKKSQRRKNQRKSQRRKNQRKRSQKNLTKESMVMDSKPHTGSLMVELTIKVTRLKAKNQILSNQ